MQKFKYIFILFSILAITSACEEEKLVDEIIDSVTSGGALRNVSETNSLSASNTSSTYSITLEAQDANNGGLLQEMRVNLGFDNRDTTGSDDVAPALFTTIPASAFTATPLTTNGLPTTIFTVTLQELIDATGVTMGNFNIDDPATGDDDSDRDVFIIDFELVLTDGRVFNLGNATGDVLRTGTFSYFNSQFRYFPTVVQ